MNDNDLASKLLASPEVSFWLKDALRKALERDPVDAASDAALLAKALDARANALLSGAKVFKHE